MTKRHATRTTKPTKIILFYSPLPARGATVNAMTDMCTRFLGVRQTIHNLNPKDNFAKPLGIASQVYFLL
jgi:hypothetical protein